jgi:hypothetical protein
MNLTTLTHSNPTYYKCRESAAVNDGVTFVPGVLYVWKGGTIPPTLKAFAANGVLETLPGEPGIGLDVLELTQRSLAPEPRREPVQEPTIGVEELCTRLGWELADLRQARATLNFPSAHAFVAQPFDAQHPDRLDAPQWFWSRVEAWLEASGPLAKALAHREG